MPQSSCPIVMFFESPLFVCVSSIFCSSSHFFSSPQDLISHQKETVSKDISIQPHVIYLPSLKQKVPNTQCTPRCTKEGGNDFTPFVVLDILRVACKQKMLNSKHTLFLVYVFTTRYENTYTKNSVCVFIPGCKYSR